MKTSSLLIFVALFYFAAANAEESFQPLLPKGHDYEDMVQFPKLKLKHGEPIIDFELKDIVGNIVKSATIRKDKILILRFIQFNLEKYIDPKEPPKGRPFPADQVRLFSVVAKHYDDKLVIVDILINDKSDKQKLIEQYEELQVGFYLVDDPEGKTLELFGIKEIPKVLFFDNEGRLYKAGNSLMQTDHLSMIIDEMLEIQKTKEEKNEKNESQQD